MHSLADYAQTSDELYRLRLEDYVLAHGGDLGTLAVEPRRNPNSPKGVNPRVHDESRFLALKAEASALRQARYEV